MNNFLNIVQTIAFTIFVFWFAFLFTLLSTFAMYCAIKEFREYMRDRRVNRRQQ